MASITGKSKFVLILNAISVNIQCCTVLLLQIMTILRVGQYLYGLEFITNYRVLYEKLV